MEIERKFLVDTEKWEVISKPEPKLIIQAYLVNTPQKTVRVRIKGAKGFLTIKGATTGISRSEFEYEIPLEDARQLIEQFAEKIIEKHRYEMHVDNHIWEVDVFYGNLKGLLIAEIELNSEDETFSKPSWIGEEVSHDPEYFNAKLIERC
jgi:CYTH domain-containing protein